MNTLEIVTHPDDCPYCGMEGSINVYNYKEQRATDFMRCPHCGGTGSLLFGYYEINPLQQNFIRWMIGKWEKGFYPFKPTQQENDEYWYKFWFDCDQEYDARERI